jgi:outer membrane protein OmpA-like peptidoglycan-associated protein
MKRVLVLILTSTLGASSLADENWSAFYLGLEGGLIEKKSVESPEVENSGPAGGVKAGWAFYNDSWRADLGLGYHTDRMEKNDVEVKTNAFFAEAGGRLALGSTSFSVGPQLQLLFGQDVSFSDAGTNSDDKQVAVLGGGRLFYDFRSEGKPTEFRTGLQILTDLHIGDRQVTTASLVFEWLWPGDQPKQQPVVNTQVVINVPEPKPVAKGPRLKVDLKSVGVTFESGSDQLKPQARQILEQMATVLIKYNEQWQLIKIDGHTDKTGNYQNNISLSRRRAVAVRDVFVQSGVPEDKIVARGFGPDLPLIAEDNKEAYARNRRVELNMISENASEQFVEELKASTP